MSQSDLDEWLKENPRPDEWNGDIWSWAFWNLPRKQVNDVNLKQLQRKTYPGQLINDVIF